LDLPDFIDSPSRGIPSGRMNYLHATLVDNPILTAERIKQIQDTYDKDSIWYKGYILGERMNPAGAIYQAHEYNVIDKIEPESYDSYVVVCDQGETISATAITLDAVKYDKDKGFYHMDVLKEYHHINSNTGDGEKHFEDYANDLADFVIESSKVMSSFPSKVIVDQDPEFYHQAVLAFQRKGLDPYIIQFPNKLEIEDRIKRGVGFMHKGQLRFYKDCSNTIEDFKNAEYDEKEIEKTGKFVRMKVYTEGFGHLDMVDSVEYAFTFFLDVLDPENESAD
jgi:PBSX family phage terminase large subunit